MRCDGKFGGRAVVNTTVNSANTPLRREAPASSRGTRQADAMAMSIDLRFMYAMQCMSTDSYEGGDIGQGHAQSLDREKQTCAHTRTPRHVHSLQKGSQLSQPACYATNINFSRTQCRVSFNP